MVYKGVYARHHFEVQLRLQEVTVQGQEIVLHINRSSNSTRQQINKFPTMSIPLRAA